MEIFEDELGKIQIDKEKLKKFLKTAGIVAAGSATAVLAPQLIPVVGSGIAKGIQEVLKEKKEKLGSELFKIGEKSLQLKDSMQTKALTPPPPQETETFDKKYLLLIGLVILGLILMRKKND
ncbi:MAG: hypothetical protein QXJ14_02810 [Candidatus Aenigmatarchaeota archaeon]